MHGFSIANELLKKVLKESKKHKGEKVTVVYIDVGKLMFLDNEELVLAWGVVSKDTIAEKAKLKINKVEGGDCILKKIVVK